ncbi:hypothetical protein EVAR_100182_1 [Eumeta japonica]|uniref:Uncharacterized protein n=1 Tax=Eumeta variegata TaxID=151549 RepID=A0A4C2A375_EUMVA|nr:hypothetical protein EVAR_100182_1 [Eumeta japonica]
MEYEAAEELAAIQKQDAEIRRELVKKRLAMNLAEIEAATECDEAEEHAVHRTEDSALVVEAWITEQRYRTECNRAQWRDVNIAVKGAGLAELADAINNWRDRGRYRAKFERALLHGNVNDGYGWPCRKSPHRRMSPTSCKLKTRRHHGSTRKKFGRPEQLVDEVLKEVKVMSRLTDSGRINDFAITTRNCVAVLQEIDEEGHIHNPVLLKEILEK